MLRLRFRSRSFMLVLPLTLLGLASCSGNRVAFVYPDEKIDMQLRVTRTPALYMDSVRDLRPPEQREGQGHFFDITYPDDESWVDPPIYIYANALAQDLEQTHLVELVPLQAQAEYVLSAEILSLGNRLERSPLSFLLSAGVGAVLGMALGDDTSNRVKLSAALGAVGLLAIPVQTDHSAEAEVRLILRDQTGNPVWERTSLGQAKDKNYMSATSRADQDLVNKYLTRAVKRCNADLLGQLRAFLLAEQSPAN